MNIPHIDTGMTFRQSYGYKWHAIHSYEARGCIQKARLAETVNIKQIWLNGAREEARKAREALTVALRDIGEMT
jgi:hypothetical protein